ncbi:MAG: nucleotide exchange factor GrpE [Clostridia bacterium]|nr:nucleotide exchange factor GrpE [Clostridia bacterium]
MAKKKEQDAAVENETPVTEEQQASTESAEKAALAATLAELDACKKELAEYKDKYLRMLAEYDNYRKRTQKEREGVYADALADTVKELLPIIDNLERASAVGDPSKIAEGLALTLKQTETAFAKLKVEETAKVGDPFDPNLHNAVMHIEDEAYGESEIVEVLQRGYRRGDKTIRDAMVKVAN